MIKMIDSTDVIARIVIIRLIIFPWTLTKIRWLEATCTVFYTRKIMILISR